jgi:glyoxylase-like metal-dependent hydrolase (beta-lactamase superfamily II)/rhodanese-related sulfurtransferase
VGAPGHDGTGNEIECSSGGSTVHVITIETPSLGDRTYLVHDGALALVVDPQRDERRVLAVAEEAGVRIACVVETHVHNDYVSGGLVLTRRTGATYVHASDEPLTFEHLGVGDSDRFDVGELSVEAVATPGHTPHHLSYVVRHGDDPPAVFTGGSLLYGSVGRTDLISAGVTEELTRAQFRSARRLADLLPDDTRVYPTHGFGSFCSSTSVEAETDGTLGSEKGINVALTIDDEDDFVRRLVEGLSAYPAYYAHMDPLNRAGGGPVDLSPPRPVDSVELARRLHAGEWVVDLRDRRAFAADHVVGTIGIELNDSFSTYLGWLIPWGMPVALLAETAEQVAEAQRQLVRIGIDRPAGAADGGVDRWGHDQDRRSYGVITFADVAETDGRVLDVRRPDERVDEHVVDSLHIPLPELLDRLDELPDEPLLVHCATGFRASIATALLDRAGRRVALIDDDAGNAAAAGLTRHGRSGADA